MNVKKTIDLGSGHKIELGTASWDKSVETIRNRYPNKTGKFNPHSSSELTIDDLKSLVIEAIKNDYIKKSDILDIIKIGLTKL